MFVLIHRSAWLHQQRLKKNHQQQMIIFFFKNWIWFYIFQQNLSKKLSRQMLFRIEKGRTFVTNVFTRIFMWVIILYTYFLILTKNHWVKKKSSLRHHCQTPLVCQKSKFRTRFIICKSRKRSATPTDFMSLIWLS